MFWSFGESTTESCLDKRKRTEVAQGMRHRQIVKKGKYIFKETWRDMYQTSIAVEWWLAQYNPPALAGGNLSFGRLDIHPNTISNESISVNQIFDEPFNNELDFYRNTVHSWTGMFNELDLSKTFHPLWCTLIPTISVFLLNQSIQAHSCSLKLCLLTQPAKHSSAPSAFPQILRTCSTEEF
jgi:hypothetical protein